MARLRGHRALNFEQPLVVRRAAVFGGRSFAAGDVLPWRQLGLSPRKLHQLWDQRRIGHEQLDERNGAESVRVGAIALPRPTKPRHASRR